MWNYCDVLRDDGVSYGDYVEQLTYLLFLKMDQENVEYLGKTSAIPPEYNWDSLRNLEGVELEHHYRTILHELGRGARGCSLSSSARPRTASRTRPSSAASSS